MPLPRASCSAAKREREKRERESALRNAGESWPLLNPDVLIELAATLDAHSLSCFPAVCRGWRDAIADSTNALWAPLLRERFPRAFVALELLPTAATVSYKEIYRDQLAATQAVHKPSAFPTTCSLSDFVFTFELFRETTVVNPPKDAEDARIHYKNDHSQQYVADHPNLEINHVNAILMQQFANLSDAAMQVYIDRAAADKARYKREQAQYEIDAVAVWNASPVVSSWTGNLDALPRRFGEDTSFAVPIRWNDWHQSWESESNAQVNPMRMNVLVSRVVKGKLRTLSIMTSDTRYDDYDAGAFRMFGAPLRCDHVFAHDQHVTPELGFVLHQMEPESDDEEDDADDWERPWNYEEITVEFKMYIPESHSDSMTSEQLLSFLEHGLRWGA